MASSSSRNRQQTAGLANNIQPYRMHVSQRYLDLTKQKLELTRLPRDARGAQPQTYDFGVSKTDLEPLIDHWLEQYDWRTQETFFNDTLPQFRASVNGTRVHFVHRRSRSPNAVPLLFIHGFPDSFISVAPMIEALCDPISTPPRGHENVHAFHVVAPSIPGFGFSDPTAEEGNAMPTTAATFDALMKMLGYNQYIAHGCGWGFRISRMLALGCPGSCLAIHTVNPEVPPPRFASMPLAWLKFQLAKLTFAFLPRSDFGYAPQEVAYGGAPSTPMSDSALPSSVFSRPTDRPQTLAYGLCDSPPGLLAYMLDAIRPPTLSGITRRSSGQGASHAFRTSLSPITSPIAERSPQPYQDRGPPAELPRLSTVWTPTAIINWTMIYWLPGPEVALRWLYNSTSLVQSLWLSYCNVPVAITQFQDVEKASGGRGQPPVQRVEAYHPIAMLVRREGRVRFASWERPAEVVMDLRALASHLSSAWGMRGAM